MFIVCEESIDDLILSLFAAPSSAGDPDTEAESGGSGTVPTQRKLFQKTARGRVVTGTHTIDDLTDGKTLHWNLPLVLREQSFRNDVACGIKFCFLRADQYEASAGAHHPPAGRLGGGPTSVPAAVWHSRRVKIRTPESLTTSYRVSRIEPLLDLIRGA